MMEQIKDDIKNKAFKINKEEQDQVQQLMVLINEGYYPDNAII